MAPHRDHARQWVAQVRKDGLIEAHIDEMGLAASDDEYDLAVDLAYAAYAQLDGRWTAGENPDPVDLGFVTYLQGYVLSAIRANHRERAAQ